MDTDYIKTYVDVLVKMRTDGTLLPISILWDNKEYKIDKVVKVSSINPKGASREILKHVCFISGQQKVLYLEDNPKRWYVEKKVVFRPCEN